VDRPVRRLPLERPGDGDAAGHVPPAKLPALERAVEAACDGRDGVADRVLARPEACAFDPRSIVCKGGDAADCLTVPQADAIAKVYAGPRARDGRPVFRGFPPGAETGPGGWGLWITGEAPGKSLQTLFARQIGANMVFDRADWDFRTYERERDQPLVEAKLAQHLNATSPDLESFRKRGGKLILFHGWNDAALPAQATIDYVEAVRARMGGEVADSFVRLYMMPGLQHCYGGPGAYDCGGMSASTGDPERDFSAALERWVEDGVAPRTMIAVKPATWSPVDAESGSAALMTRPLCAHPRVAIFGGKGSPDDPSSYACATP
jgi:feruloyl esterase